MIHLIHCSFQREKDSDWENGLLVSTDYDGQEGAGVIILHDGTVLISIEIWNIRVQHHYGHIPFHLEPE